VGLAFALAAVTLAVFGASVGFELVHLDDRRYLADNDWIAQGVSLDTLRRAFGLHFSNWHPLTWLSWALDVELFGGSPAGFHATNVALHVANSLLVFALLERATGAAWPSAGAAALFAWHPLHVEPVAWVSERKELLAALFGLLAVAAHQRFARLGGRRRQALVAAAMALSLMAKPMWVTLPLLLLALDHWPLGRLAADPRARIREKLPLFALSLAASAVTLIAQRPALRAGASLALADRLANALVAPARYLAKAVWPAELSVLYPHPALPGGTPLTGFELAAGAAVVAALGFAALRGPAYARAGIAWFAIALVPVLGLVQVGPQGMADRYTYVPLLGVFAAAAFAANDALAALRARQPRAAQAGAVLIVCLLAAYALRSADQVGAWRDTLTLYRRSLAATPDSTLLRLNLGNRLLERGLEREAISHFEDALRRRPDWGPPAQSLAWLLATTGDAELRDPERALALAEIARADTDDPANTLDTLAAAQAAAGDFAAAAATAARAVELSARAGLPGRARAFEARRRLYAQGLPYVEPRPASGPASSTSNSSVR
jgi:tetratricopeptide (TPR) repeat protein